MASSQWEGITLPGGNPEDRLEESPGRAGPGIWAAPGIKAWLVGSARAPPGDEPKLWKTAQDRTRQPKSRLDTRGDSPGHSEEPAGDLGFLCRDGQSKR